MNTEISISILLFFVSAILYFFPPKKINYFYGYRTKMSMKNLENWKFANHYSSIIMVLFSIFNILVFYIAFLFINEINKNIFGVILIIEFAILFYLTEKKIKKNKKK
jgi:uncharacterized membrane protein